MRPQEPPQGDESGNTGPLISPPPFSATASKLRPAPEGIDDRELVLAEVDPGRDQGALADELVVEELEALLLAPLHVLSDVEVLRDAAHHLRVPIKATSSGRT